MGTIFKVEEYNVDNGKKVLWEADSYKVIQREGGEKPH